MIVSLKGWISNRRNAKTVTMLKLRTRGGKKKEKGKNSAQVTFHCAFPFTLNRPITNRRKTKIHTIVKTVTRVKSFTGRWFQARGGGVLPYMGHILLQHGVCKSERLGLEQATIFHETDRLVEDFIQSRLRKPGIYSSIGQQNPAETNSGIG